MKQKIDKLRIRLWFHRCLYYIHNTTSISDYEYDKCERELIELESKTKYRINDSPTRRVGYDPPDYLKNLIDNLVKTHFKLEQEITCIPDYIKLWSDIDVNPIDRICFRNTEILSRHSPSYIDRVNRIKLEIKQGKYSIIEPPKREAKPVFIPELEKMQVCSKINNIVYPLKKPKNVDERQLSLFG